MSPLTFGAGTVDEALPSDGSSACEVLPLSRRHINGMYRKLQTDITGWGLDVLDMVFLFLGVSISGKLIDANSMQMRLATSN